MAKKIVKLIKDSKLKVQAQIQGDEIRVTGKARDDLQSVMALIRGADLGQPFQFKNFRD
ncbi:putative nucleotide-binding protein [compost metagenome]